MAGEARPTQGQIYRAPGDEGAHAVAPYRPPGVPAPRIPGNELFTGEPHQAPERMQDQRGGGALDRTAVPRIGATPPAPRVGDTVVHRVSGQRGTVVGHQMDAHRGTAIPQVTWAGEDKSWPQGVAPNAIRVDGSTPNRLYETEQDATSHRPRRRYTGAQ